MDCGIATALLRFVNFNRNFAKVHDGLISHLELHSENKLLAISESAKTSFQARYGQAESEGRENVCREQTEPTEHQHR